ncbi:methionyl-tRNA formyltransferase [Ketobacter sp. MCCC 1A13808]|uniref:methionyl-tRNA formyltransferase n=1 Tax=Ketobacter sp. MCCC 1A13808 TaxID=2602738 RepID=UPI000F0DE7BB|nr:methionyl-tRNA formyltransferase [Ketobacter sp. MCCC 1A13808]MVF14280.1 methionyl-tRNA formyltransferase [Ketobacter sp. MCCC 1A13808]RLP53531.1 MAG: methionyl-tRNA formyltransferase [Ketobacter sp.]
MTSPLKIIFAGTPDFAASSLQAILDSPHQVIACYTQPDRPAGRGRKLTPSPVKALARQQGIPVYQPLNFKPEQTLQQLDDLKADLMVVVAYGLLLPKAVLETPRLGCINVHASLLPRWRGAAPIQRAIAAGDVESGVTIMQMDVGLDTGDMLLKVNTHIQPEDTGGSLHDRLAGLGAKALVHCLDLVATGQLSPEPQPHDLANYAHKLSKDDARLDWRLSATELHNRIRAFNPWPVAHTELEGERVRVWQSALIAGTTTSAAGTLVNVCKEGIDVATGEGVLRLQELQFSGGKRLTVEALLNSKGDWLVAGKQLH